MSPARKLSTGFAPSEYSFAMAMAAILGTKRKRKPVPPTEEEKVRIAADKERADWNAEVERRKAEKKGRNR